MLTGLRPDQTGVINLSTHFREKLPEVVTLPQLFRKNGFYTVSTGKIFHPVRRLRDSLSWDAPESVYGTHTYADARNKGGKKRKGRAYERADVPDDIYPDGKIAAEAVAYLERVAKSGEPFFLAVGFMRPHLPFCAPAKYWDLYADESFEIRHPEPPKGAARLAFHDNNELRGYAGMPKQGPFPPEERQQLTRGYYASVSYIDAQLGKVMDALVRLGLADNTVVVLWGDHGYHLGEQGLWCKSTNFELDTRVPLIVSVPGGKGGHCDAVVETVDIYPTLADYCGVEPPGELAGVSLRPLLEKRGEYRKQYAFSQFVRPYQAINKRVETHMGYSVRTPRWRCTYWYDLKTGEVAEKELYRKHLGDPLNDFIVPYHSSELAMAGSTDVGDVSWVCPTAQVNTACYASGTPGHSWQLVAQGKAPVAHAAMLQAGRVMAGTAIDLFESPELLEKAKAEHAARVGDGYVCPIPAGVKPRPMGAKK